MDEKTKAVTGDAGAGITSKEEAVKGTDFQAKEAESKPAPNPGAIQGSNVGRVVSRPAPKPVTTNVANQNQDLKKISDSNLANRGKSNVPVGQEAVADATKSGEEITVETGKVARNMSGPTGVSEKQAARNEEKTDLLKRITAIEEEYYHNIGDIPRDNEYWDLLNAYRRKP